jgi:hypothetical protein
VQVSEALAHAAAAQQNKLQGFFLCRSSILHMISLSQLGLIGWTEKCIFAERLDERLGWVEC